MKKILLFLAIAPALAFSQAMPQNVRATFTMDRMMNGITHSGNDIIGLAAPPSKVVGNPYLDKKWNIGSLMMTDKDKPVESILLRFNLAAQDLEVKTSTGVRVLDVKKIAQLSWIDSLTHKQRFFVNAADYTEGGVPQVGLLELLADGPRSLFMETFLKVKVPNYNQALDAGNRDTQLSKNDKFFYNNGKELIEIKNKKSLLVAFDDKATDVSKFMKLNQLNANNSRDLKLIFDYYNSLMSAKQGG